MSARFSIGQMNQLADALEAAEFSPEDVTKLGQFNNLTGIRDILNGIADIAVPKHIVNLDPFVPDGWKVEEHVRGGRFKWDPAKIALFITKGQKSGLIDGYRLRQELGGQPVLNANVMDYLLAHPTLIPEEWKGKTVFFWGTIYRDSFGRLGVRCLDWYSGQWCWGYGCLGRSWGSNGPAAVSASI